MEFRCRLGTAGGEIIEGVYVADSEAHLRRDLEEKGLFVLSLQRRGMLPAVGLSRGSRRRIGRQELLVFNQELATLIKAGMPLVQSLDILRQRVSNPTFKAVLDGVYQKVKAGTALSDAFGEHPDLFPGVYSASLMAGERAGNLDEVIRRYVAYEKVIGAVKRRTISALIYPAILVTMMLILIGIIVLRVVPAFSEFYSNFGRQLPLSTRIIIGISNFTVGNLPFIAIGTVAAAVALSSWWKRPGQRTRIDRMLLELPWAGATVRKFSTAQLARTLATLLGGGIPLVNALEIAGRSMSNRYLAGELVDVTRRVREGEGFAAGLRERGVFADVAVKMVEVGESTGALQEMLNSLAEFYDEEIETEVQRFITLIEPVILVVMGAVIALVVLALYMPLFELSSVVQ
ncbi:MAG TPA: type II secretion system F family protein [Vicinamibacterales bacterium]|jgi:type IV pilus assembly protein PilC|nr:type II secretion system F family protein [Vicinamibacterales bacterium]